MKLLITIIISIAAYFGMVYFGAGSITIWIALIVLWAVIDYFTYKNPFNWKDYVVLVIVLSAVEIAEMYSYFGLL